VSFEGIGAGIHGVVARSLAIGCLALGRTDDAVAYARQALPISARLGAVLGADAERTLAETLDRRDGPGDRAEAATRHAAADRAYAAAGLDHLVPAGATAAPTGAPPVPLVSTGPPVPARAAVPAGELVHDGDVWRATWAGTTVIVRPVKGLTDLARLLAAAGREVHVAELVGADPAVFGGDAGEALDGRAIAAYRDRLLELAEEVDDAEAAHDLARAERAHAEHDALVEQLAAAVGLAGRRRRAGPDPVERARKAVTARLRDAIGRLERVHPALGRHLAVSIRTGTYCSYQPEQPVVWRCQP
jgi:hypothetical protein